MTRRATPRVLLVGPELVLRWTESTALALDQLGCAVEIVFYNRSPLQNKVRCARRAIAERLGLGSVPMPHWIQRRYAAWLSAKASRAMVQTARAFRPDLVLILKGESFRPEMLRELKEATGVTLAVWWVDHPFMNAETRHPWDHVPACIPLYDHCFVFDHAYEPSLQAAGARAVGFLPCAADPALFTPQTLSRADRETYGAEVSLIGVYSTGRERIVAAVGQEPGFGVWGPGWSGYFSGRPSVGLPPFRGEMLVPSEACKVYNASPINLNSHHAQTQRAGLNTRAFEIPAAGGFELTDYVQDMESLLEPDREVAVYRSPEEARDRARYFLKAEPERRRIAEAGHKRVLAEHTYRHRMQTVLDALCA